MRTRLALVLAASGVFAGGTTVAAQQAAAPAAHEPLQPFASERQFLDFVRTVDCLPGAGGVIRSQPFGEDSLAASSARSVSFIEGRVTLASGAPGAGASVSIDDTDIRTSADSSGRYRIVLTPARLRASDNLSLGASLSGARHCSRTFALRPGSVVHLDFALRATPRDSGDARLTTMDPMLFHEDAGVHRGGTVQRHGEFLIVLRDGRLYTARLGKQGLVPIGQPAALGPRWGNADTASELLSYRDLVIVVTRGGYWMVLDLLRIDRAGSLRLLKTYMLRSRSPVRLIGSRLILRDHTLIGEWRAASADVRPDIRLAEKGSPWPEMTTIDVPHRTYRPVPGWDGANGVYLHSLTTCDLERTPLHCEVETVAGPRLRSAYLSRHALYLWTMDPRDVRDEPAGKDIAAGRSVLFRLPLDGGAPRAIRAAGAPLNVHSWHEGTDRHLNVLVRGDSAANVRNQPYFGRGSIALLRLALSDLGDGRSAAPAAAYRSLPLVGGFPVNRIVGERLLYGGTEDFEMRRLFTTTLRIVPLAGGSIDSIRIRLNAEVLEPMRDAVLVAGQYQRGMFVSRVEFRGHARVGPALMVGDTLPGQQWIDRAEYAATGRSSGVVALAISGVRFLDDPPRSEELPRTIVFVRDSARRFEALGRIRGPIDARRAVVCDPNCELVGAAQPYVARGGYLGFFAHDVVEAVVRKGQITGERSVNITQPPPLTPEQEQALRATWKKPRSAWTAENDLEDVKGFAEAAHLADLRHGGGVRGRREIRLWIGPSLEDLIRFTWSNGNVEGEVIRFWRTEHDSTTPDSESTAALYRYRTQGQCARLYRGAEAEGCLTLFATPPDWKAIWRTIDSLGVRDLPDASTLTGEVVVLDGWGIVVELWDGSKYRAWHYSNPQDQPWPEAKQALAIMQTLYGRIAIRRSDAEHIYRGRIQARADTLEFWDCDGAGPWLLMANLPQLIDSTHLRERQQPFFRTDPFYAAFRAIPSPPWLARQWRVPLRYRAVLESDSTLALRAWSADGCPP